MKCMAKASAGVDWFVEAVWRRKLLRGVRCRARGRVFIGSDWLCSAHARMAREAAERKERAA